MIITTFKSLSISLGILQNCHQPKLKPLSTASAEGNCLWIPPQLNWLIMQGGCNFPVPDWSTLVMLPPKTLDHLCSEQLSSFRFFAAGGQV